MSLEDGESVVAAFDPMAEFDADRNAEGRKTYTFYLRVNEKPAFISGGNRLFAQFSNIPTRPGVVKVRITAKGAARSFERDYKVEVVK